jgi:hypothetical protein
MHQASGRQSQIHSEPQGEIRAKGGGMRLKRVTITGADDSISAHNLKSISKEFPFVEWGILFSLSSQGGYRFPSERWIAQLPEGLNYAAHLCGRYVRDLVLDVNPSWESNRYNRPEIFQRVQLNFHGQFHKAHFDLGNVLSFRDSVHWIFQCDGVNDESVKRLVLEEPDLREPLFDTSGGAGVLPDTWPDAWPGIYCGYAGGLGPDNVLEQLGRVRRKTEGQAFWIDMERRVRSEDDSRFDLDKVTQVLADCAPLVV